MSHLPTPPPPRLRENGTLHCCRSDNSFRIIIATTHRLYHRISDVYRYRCDVFFSTVTMARWIVLASFCHRLGEGKGACCAPPPALATPPPPPSRKALACGLPAALGGCCDACGRGGGGEGRLGGRGRGVVAVGTLTLVCATKTK